MRRDPSDIDRLIEEGLDRYGSGDIDGALLAWERALELEPDNEQVNSYVEYVRTNYDLLAAAQIDVDDSGAPFAIEEEPEYEIEITGGELESGEPGPLTIEVKETGWTLEDEETRERPPREGELTLELEAEEPPPSDGINFEDATKEYQGQRAKLDEPEFQTEESTGGFSSHTTDVKQRNLGFVQPAGGPPELPKVTLRTPKTTEKPAISKAATIELAPSPSDLIASLPTPRPTGTGAGPIVPSPAQNAASPPPPVSAPTAYADTAPGFKPPPDEPNHTRAATDGEPAISAATTKEFAGVPTAKLPSPQQLQPEQTEEPAISQQATQDLGIRPKRASSVIDEEAPTTQADVRQIREHAARLQAEGTKKDIVLPFDPIDARSAQILDEVDADAPASETKEERTRRRITDLIERAQAWSGITELDKAITAIELALSEDPNSALAQKLIHRNRDTIMTIFQSFLGDLERQPALARPLHELASAPISPRAAFLLSRIDGTLTLDEILDVSGMPRLEAYRHLCQLFLRGILR